MIKKKATAAGAVFVACLCLILSASFTGCADGQVESTVSDVISRIGADMDETISRVESALNPDDELDSALNSDWDHNNSSGLSSNYVDDFDDGYSSQPGLIESQPESGIDDDYGYNPDTNGNSGANLNGGMEDNGITGDTGDDLSSEEDRDI